MLVTLMSLTSFGQILKQPPGQMWYWEYKDPACVSCPIVVFLHGSGERSNTPNLSLVQRNGLPKILKAQGKDFITGFTVICPQQLATTWDWIRNPNDPDIVKFVKYIRATIPNDGRVYITGLSMGGRGALDASYLLESGLVTAIVPVSTNGDYKWAIETAKRKIPAWIIYGSNDTAFPKNEFQNPINGMRDGGFPAKVNIITGGTHSSSTWDVAFSLTDRPELGGTTIYKWLLAQGTPSIPTEPIKEKVIEQWIQDGKLYSKGENGTIKIN